jgi:hypothetical protein
MPTKYANDFTDFAVRLVTEPIEDHETECAGIQVVASRLIVGG